MNERKIYKNAGLIFILSVLLSVNYLFISGCGGGGGGGGVGSSGSTFVCGNGIYESPEQCDDGNVTSGDGCSSSCASETGGQDMFAETYTQSNSIRAYDMTQSSDGGYVMVGYYYYSTYRGYVLKIDSTGNKEWENSYTNIKYLNINSIDNTSDGGYVVAGYSLSSYGGWGAKLDSDGDVIWDKELGTSRNAFSVVSTSNGGYVLTGDNDYSVWVIMLDSSGNEVWEYEDEKSDYVISSQVIETSDGDIVVAGAVSVGDYGYYDMWLLRLDSNGDKEWEKYYGDENYSEIAYSLIETHDGGILLAGKTNHDKTDARLVKIDSSGKQEWARTIGASNYSERFNSVTLASDGGYVAGGYTSKDDAAFFVKVDYSGNVIRGERFSLGYTERDYVVQRIITTDDGGYAAAGYYDKSKDYIPFIKMNALFECTGCDY